MAITLHFSAFGDGLEIRRDVSCQRARYEYKENGISPMNFQEFIRCLLLTPCSSNCSHRVSQEFELSLDDSEETWLLEILYTALDHHDQKIQCRAATIIGSIGNRNAIFELMKRIINSNSNSDNYWAIFDALRRLDSDVSLIDMNYQ